MYDYSVNPVDEHAPNFQQMIVMLIEARAAARTLYGLVPDQEAVGPLYHYLDDVLNEVSHALSLISLLDHGGKQGG